MVLMVVKIPYHGLGGSDVTDDGSSGVVRNEGVGFFWWKCQW